MSVIGLQLVWKSAACRIKSLGQRIMIKNQHWPAAYHILCKNELLTPDVEDILLNCLFVAVTNNLMYRVDHSLSICRLYGNSSDLR